MHWVVALFSFIYPKAYLEELCDTFGDKHNKIMDFRRIKRIDIYQYFTEASTKIGMNKKNSDSQN